MAESVIPAQVADVVLSSFDLPLRRTFFPLGYPLQLETNSRDVILAAEECWGANEQLFQEDPVRISLGVAEGGTEAPAPLAVIRAREHLMSVISDPANFLLCDFERSFAFGWVTPGTAADRALLRYQFLMAGAIALVQQRAFAPLHGALVMRNGSGVMLCGDSHAGKSTLAFACARAGWRYVTDDGAFLVRSRDDRFAVGDPHSIRFRPDASGLFPELARHAPAVRPNGKIALEIYTRGLDLETASGCIIDHVVFLEREPRRLVCLDQYPHDRALDYWSQYTQLGPEEVRAAQRHCHELLLHAGIWRMRYSHLDDAVARLEHLADQGF